MRSSDWSSDVCSSDLGHSVPEASNHYLYLIKLTFSTGCCYPEGNFGGNQLLDGSISLSPLYPSSTLNLHVRIATSLQQRDRKRVVWGKSVSVRVDLGGRRNIKKKKLKHDQTNR